MSESYFSFVILKLLVTNIEMSADLSRKKDPKISTYRAIIKKGMKNSKIETYFGLPCVVANEISLFDFAEEMQTIKERKLWPKISV